MTNTRTVHLVSEGYGEWEPVSVNERRDDDAKALVPESQDWREDRGVLRNPGAGRDLFVRSIPYITMRRLA